MKKKMTVIGVLLLAVMVTAYSVAGTFAKYTSGIDLSDEVRVAEWGVNIEQNVNLFSNSYVATYNTNNSYEYVKASSKVVAPGTTGTYTAKFSGSSEVAYIYKLYIDGKDLLNATEDEIKGFAKHDFIVYYKLDNENNISDMTVDDKSNDNSWTAYRPLRYSISTNASSSSLNSLTGSYDLHTLITGIKTYITVAGNTPHDPGTIDNKTITITWKWDANNTVDGLTPEQVNQLDTYAGENLSADAKKISLNLKVALEQYTAADYSAGNYATAPTPTP